jgi:hypothetical protein
LLKSHQGTEGMKHKVSELDGAPLDAAVAKAEGVELIDGSAGYPTAWDHDLACWRGWSACRDWRIGGPIIERDRITLKCHENGWHALVDTDWSMSSDEVPLNWKGDGEGDTPLLAAMRAYVASKFGDEIDL